VALTFVNEFVVAAPIDATWQALVDVERVARCLPGATIRPGETADTFNGSMRIKLGPMTMEYQGVAEISSLDHEGHRVFQRPWLTSPTCRLPSRPRAECR
jgi:uncharacterized protein